MSLGKERKTEDAVLATQAVPAPPTAQVRPRLRSQSKISVTEQKWTTGVHVEEGDQRIRHRDTLVRTFLVSYCLMLVFICTVILMQGFRSFGFQLDTTSIKWLGGTVLAQLVGLLAVIVREVFKRIGR